MAADGVNGVISTERWGHQPDEAEHDDPWNCDWFRAVEETFPPCSRCIVTGCIAVMRVDHQVEIRKDHRCASAMKSSTSS